jgi:hypothetical protein
MTLKEALAAVVSQSVSDNVLEKALADWELLGDDLYTNSSALLVDAAAVDVLFNLWASPNVSEGGFSVSYDRTALKDKIIILATKSGRKDILSAMTPTVSGASPW